MKKDCIVFYFVLGLLPSEGGQRCQITRRETLVEDEDFFLGQGE